MKQLNCKVIMLDVLHKNDPSRIHKHTDETLELMTNPFGNGYFGVGYPQHLYLVSNREIKEGDWTIHLATNTIYQCKHVVHDNKVIDCKKIEATTDTSLVTHPTHYEDGTKRAFHTTSVIPQIPQSFIEAYVKANGKIEEVSIEIETVGKYGNILLAKSPHNNKTNSDMSIYIDIVKTRSDNTVIIHQAKTYTRDEVINLCRKAFHAGLLDKVDINKWIEENL